MLFYIQKIPKKKANKTKMKKKINFFWLKEMNVCVSYKYAHNIVSSANKRDERTYNELLINFNSQNNKDDVNIFCLHSLTISFTYSFISYRYFVALRYKYLRKNKQVCFYISRN